MSYGFLFLNIILTFTVIWFANKRKRIINSLPTLCWFSFIVMPLIFSWKYFPSPARDIQVIGVSLISIALAIGDYHSSTKTFTSIDFSINRKYRKILMICISIIISLVPIYHYYKVGYIPLINKYFGNYSVVELRDQRENYNKFALPYIFSVLSNQAVIILSPLLIGLFVFVKKYYLSLLVFLWIAFYSLSSNSKDSFIIFISSVLMVVVFLKTEKHRTLLSKVFASAFILTIIFGILHAETMIRNADKCPLPIEANYSPGNINRSCTKEVFDEIKTFPIIDSIGYRVFLTPIEVSNDWYQYYSNNNNSFRSASDLLDRNLSSSAANKVGIEFFQRIFPDRYGISVSAYSSIDSDAYSFGGMFIVFLVALLLLIVRLSLISAMNSESILARILYAIGLTQMTLLPWQSSIQAMLFSQGLLLISIFLLVLNKSKRSLLFFK